MFAAGAHYGYSKTRRHPSTSKYIFTTKNKVDLIDLEKSSEMLAAAQSFVAELSRLGKQILIVGVKPEAKGAARDLSLELSMPVVTERWVGGCLTNYPEIKKRIERLEQLKADRASGALDKYTKKERGLLDIEIEKLNKLFSGLVNLKKTPDALFVVDPKREHIAVTEAHKMGVPVIALCSTDTNLKGIEHPILGNDGSIASIKFFMNKIGEAYRGGYHVA